MRQRTIEITEINENRNKWATDQKNYRKKLTKLKFRSLKR